MADRADNGKNRRDDAKFLGAAQGMGSMALDESFTTKFAVVLGS